MEYINVIRDRYFESCVDREDAMVRLLSVADREIFLIQASDRLDDIATRHEAESVDQREARILPFGCAGHDSGHLLNIQMLRESVNEKSARVVFEARYVLPVGSVGQRADDTNHSVRVHAPHQPA